MSSPSLLLQALTEAYKGRGQCSPNPAVGSVIVDSNNQIVATGYHKGPGLPHAEIDALQKINFKASGMTIFVTLEPCCHHGRTPPCTDALIQSGIKHVVYGYKDPNPIVAGKGAAILEKAGITCELISLPEINNFYESYTYWHKTKKPYITAKIAMSLDGIIAAKNGNPIQITGEELAEYTHYQRKISDAILTTAKTIKNDNPKLNARYQNTVTSKPIYILDTELSIPSDAQIFQTAKSITLFHGKQASDERMQTLKKLGARCVLIEGDAAGLNLQKVIEYIGNEGVHDLWIEAGGKCFSSFLENKLLQRMLIYIAPKWLGEGIPAFDNSIFSFKDYAPKNITWKQMGCDGVLEIILKKYDK